jgi:hypothetical protein
MVRIKNELIRVKLIDNAFHTIENHYILNFYSDSCENNETLNEFYSLEESTQVGVQLTAQMSQAFYSYLKYRANKYLESQNSFLRVVTTREFDSKQSYDLVLIDNDTKTKYYIEIKLSQNKNSWQGSTSSTSKVDLFLLINFKIDRNKKLNILNNSGLFSGVFAALINMKNKKWSGKPKDNNHRTKFEFKLNEWDIDILKESSIIKGGFDTKRTLAHLVLQNIENEFPQHTHSL